MLHLLVVVVHMHNVYLHFTAANGRASIEERAIGENNPLCRMH